MDTTNKLAEADRLYEGGVAAIQDFARACVYGSDEDRAAKGARLGGWLLALCNLAKDATPSADQARTDEGATNTVKMVARVKHLADELSMADGARDIPTGALWRGITQSQYAAKRQELHAAIDQLATPSATQATQAVSEPVAWQWSVGGTPPWNDCDEETYRKQAKWPGVKVRTLGVLEEK